MADINELKTELSQLISSLVQGEKEMVSIAPEMVVQLQPLFEASAEDLEKAVDTLTESIPEEHREDALQQIINNLKQGKEYQDFTRWRLDSRVQPEGEPRVRPKFKSFCKRKGEW